MKSVDDSDGRVSLTLRPCDLKHADVNTEEVSTAILSSFKTYISERDYILQEMKCTSTAGSDGPTPSFSALASAFVPGGRVSGHVTSVVDDVAIVGLEDVSGRIGRASLHGQC